MKYCELSAKNLYRKRRGTRITNDMTTSFEKNNVGDKVTYCLDRIHKKYNKLMVILDFKRNFRVESKSVNQRSAIKRLLVERGYIQPSLYQSH